MVLDSLLCMILLSKWMERTREESCLRTWIWQPSSILLTTLLGQYQASFSQEFHESAARDGFQVIERMASPPPPPPPLHICHDPQYCFQCNPLPYATKTTVSAPGPDPQILEQGHLPPRPEARCPLCGCRFQYNLQDTRAGSDFTYVRCRQAGCFQLVKVADRRECYCGLPLARLPERSLESRWTGRFYYVCPQPLQHACTYHRYEREEEAQARREPPTLECEAATMKSPAN